MALITPYKPQSALKQSPGTILGGNSSPASFGSEAYQALGGLSQDMINRGREIQNEKDRDALIRGRAELDGWTAKYLFNPNKNDPDSPIALMRTTGLEADGITDLFSQEYQSQAEKIAQNMKSPQQRDLFLQYAEEQSPAYLSITAKHQAAQHRIAGAQAALSGNESAKNMALADPSSQDLFDLAANTVRTNNQLIYGKFGSQAVERMNEEDISDIRLGQLRSLLDRDDGGLAAEEFLTTYEENILPEERGKIRAAVSKAAGAQRARMAAAELYARHGLDEEDAARQELEKTWGKDGNFKIYSSSLKAKYLDERISKKRAQQEAVSKLTASLYGAASFQDVIKLIDKSEVAEDEKERFYEAQKRKYEALASPLVTMEQRQWAQYELKGGLLKHLGLVEEKEGKLARGEEIGGEDLRKYDLAEERLKEYGQFVKTGGYGLKSAGEDERISYSADQNVDIPPSYDWGTFDFGGEKQEPPGVTDDRPDDDVPVRDEENSDIPPAYDWGTFDVGGEKQEPPGVKDDGPENDVPDDVPTQDDETSGGQSSPVENGKKSLGFDDLLDALTFTPASPIVSGLRGAARLAGVGRKTVRAAEGIGKAERAGKLTGKLDVLTQAERTMVDDLLKQGKNVEIVPRSNVQGVQIPDFKINGVSTELKTLTGTSLNTPVTRIQEAFKQGKNALLDARGNPNITSTEVETIFKRIEGIYKGGIPGEIEIWTNNGIFRR